MTDLPTRLEGAAAGSRELDAEVIVALRLGCMTGMPDDLHYLSVPRKDDECAPGTYWFHQRSGASLRTAEPVTTSIDAAVAFAERMLPGWGWSVGQGGGEKAFARLDTPDGHDFEQAYGHTPELAICAAIIRAHAEQVQG